MNNRKKVAVAMSGGVDSSVTAALLNKQGYDVIGIMLRLWSERGKESHNRCCTPESISVARRVASRIGIPFYVIDAQEPFYETVVSYFIEGYAKNITPNPCLVCNRFIRWDFLLKHAESLGAQYLATGHYAKVERTEGDQIRLFRAVDLKKDQSYVLYSLDQTQLSKTLLPLGIYKKSEVRNLSNIYNLPSANRKDSQDLCFIGKDDYREFLARAKPEINSRGPINNLRGDLLGEHNGLAHYTIGQRKGIGVSAEQPYYVIEKNVEGNSLIIGTKNELGKKGLSVKNVGWISGHRPSDKFSSLVKIRYNSPSVECTVTSKSGNKLHVDFKEPIVGAAPGQAAVFYHGNECLGGGIINK